MASGNYLKSFGVSTVYTFPVFQAQLRDNFSDMVPRTVRIPGVDGGFDQYGLDKAPNEIGNVSVTFQLAVDEGGDRDDMNAKRDLVRAMAAWGVTKLIKSCGDDGDRYCYARVNSIVMTEAPQDPIKPLLCVVTVDFQVADPGWFEDGTWGDTQDDWTDAVSLTAGIQTNASLDSPPAQLSAVGGIFPTFPKIKITGTAITEIGITWLAADEEGELTSSSAAFRMTGLSTTVVLIDCATMTVEYGQLTFGVGTDGFVKVTNYDYANFIKLQPGTGNWIRIWVVGGASQTAVIAWRERH